MPQKTKNAHVAVSDEEWRRFRSRCVRAGVDIRDRLAELVRGDIDGPALPAPAEIPGQLSTDDAPKRSSKRRSPATARKAASSQKSSGQTQRRRKPLPTVSDALVASEGAAAAKAARAASTPAKRSSRKRSK